jgi:hypothetical protein
VGYNTNSTGKRNSRNKGWLIEVSEFDFSQGKRFSSSSSSQLSDLLGHTQAYMQLAEGALSERRNDRDMKLINCFHMAQRLRMCGIISPLHHASSWYGA